ncbi:MAG: protein-methionine-sulfoxide reductase catalytic subunit MsrP [Methylococcales bacterium]|nr:protein-methionine-sulfoxide reductase catalytic subunit MsrP [Methylococcales bacterium]
MIIKTEPAIPSSQITPEAVYQQRRSLLKAALGTTLVAAWPAQSKAQGHYSDVGKGPYSLDIPPTSVEDVSSYNNYYEFSTSKTEPAVLAQRLTIEPWTLIVEGEAENTGTFDLEQILREQPLEERIYRFRCVEAWAMVVPWIGFPLGRLLKQFKPTEQAKFVEFTSLYRPSEMPGQKRGVLPWPYVEGLRIDEAMHSLTLLAVGMYDDRLPKQNGAPLRLVVPWKYGFKSTKAIVKIRFTRNQPRTAWNVAAPNEYGFYANVNPDVAHPRWSQARERLLGASIFTPKHPTQLFNGYARQVASLYSGMDLQRFF